MRDRICLLTDDGALTTIKLAQSLTEKGWKVVVLSFPDSLKTFSFSLPAGISRVVLEELNEDYLKRKLAAIADTYGSIAAFIHLHPSFEFSHNHRICFPEVDKAIVKEVFLIAKYLKSSLLTAAEQGYSCFITVSRLDGAFGLEQKVNFSPISAGLCGLTKSLNLEWENVYCRAIDLSPNLSSELSVEYILAELHDPNRCLSEVGYGFSGRITLI